MITVKIQIQDRTLIPHYQTDGSAGADLHASIQQPVIIPPGGILLVPTGIIMEIPEGFEGQIRPRSGLALNHGITLLNSPGTIDSDYRGEIKIIMINLSTEPFTITPAMRIAQIVFNQISRAEFIETSQLNITMRNSGGFGHSGI